MADDCLLAYIDDREVAELFNQIHKGYPLQGLPHTATTPPWRMGASTALSASLQ
jgi:hypothetical protein